MGVVARQFQQSTGHRIQLVPGSTGKLATQIRHGAPFEVFLAADEATPRSLESEALGVSGSRFTYAIGSLVLWSPQKGLVDGEGKVLSWELSRIALADPKVAPYGRAAVECLQSLGHFEALKARFIQGESIAQAHQFIVSGHVPLGFVALSQIQKDGQIASGSYWIVPQALYHPLRQDALLLAKGKNNPGAHAFLAFLRQDPARAILRAYGYTF